MGLPVPVLDLRQQLLPCPSPSLKGCPAAFLSHMENNKVELLIIKGRALPFALRDTGISLGGGQHKTPPAYSFIWFTANPLPAGPPASGLFALAEDEQGGGGRRSQEAFEAACSQLPLPGHGRELPPGH